MFEEISDERVAGWAERLCDQGDDLEVEFFSGGRGMVVALAGGGETIVRPHGGPLYSFGQLQNRRRETLQCWRSRSPERFARILQWLVEAEFPRGMQGFNLVADERPSRISVRHREGIQASMSIVYRATQEIPALASFESELSHLCYEESQKPSVDTIANPELGSWEGVEGGPPRRLS